MYEQVIPFHIEEEKKSTEEGKVCVPLSMAAPLRRINAAIVKNHLNILQHLVYLFSRVFLSPIYPSPLPFLGNTFEKKLD